MHNPIKINCFSLSFPNKICFEDFSTDIAFGARIAIIGRNGSGKSSLLKMIADNNRGLSLEYIHQIINNFDSLSGGERFNKSLSQAIGENPSILLLDEPTNHLDSENRKNLMRMLLTYYGTLIIATHDEELLQNCIDILWHIDNGKITVFHGKYADYMSELHLKHQAVYNQIELLEREKKSMHECLMKEQKRASKSKASGEKKLSNKKWMRSVCDLKAMKSEKSQGKKLRNLDEKKQKLSEQLRQTRLPEKIIPKFNLPYQKIVDKTIVLIVDGNVEYKKNIILRNINLSVLSQEHVAIVGKNGSGKTTLVKAIMNNADIVKYGDWNIPDLKDIGYLDQHYDNLNSDQTAIEIISNTNPKWSYIEIRKHLNDFLFRKNEEVSIPTRNLSGGEKARLSLSQIAANVPKLLILDEVTNNMDLETKNHISEILSDYPTAMIVISHDEVFLKKIKIDKYYQL